MQSLNRFYKIGTPSRRLSMMRLSWQLLIDKHYVDAIYRKGWCANKNRERGGHLHPAKANSSGSCFSDKLKECRGKCCLLKLQIHKSTNLLVISFSTVPVLKDWLPNHQKRKGMRKEREINVFVWRVWMRVGVVPVSYSILDAEYFN